MQLSAFADLDSATWDLSVDGQWLGAGPEDRSVLSFMDVDPDDSGSIRLVAVWLENGDTYSLIARRPRNAKGQDRDVITVTLPESTAPLSAFDPRLSTEYSLAGTPRRFGIELWLGEDPEGDQRPLRMAGEADGAPLESGTLSAYPMHAHSAGVAGRGLYVLVRP